MAQVSNGGVGAGPAPKLAPGPWLVGSDSIWNRRHSAYRSHARLWRGQRAGSWPCCYRCFDCHGRNALYRDQLWPHGQSLSQRGIGLHLRGPGNSSSSRVCNWLGHGDGLPVKSADVHRHILPRRLAHAGRTGRRRQAARLGPDWRDPRSQGRCPAAVPWPAAKVRVRNPRHRCFASRVAASGPALGRTGRLALGVGRGAGSRRPHGLERIAGEGRGRLRPVDDEPLRLVAQPAVSPAASHGPPDFSLHGRRADTEEASQDRTARAGRSRLRSVALAARRVSKQATRRGDSRNRRPSPGFRRSLPSPASRSLPGSRRSTSRTHSKRHQRKGRTGCGFGRTRAFSGRVSIWSRTWTVPNDPKLETALDNPRLSVLGIVWNKVDDIMHGMQMQTAGMHNQVRLWASQGHLQQLLTRLQQEGFVVYLTADHGNVTATGIGNPREGVLVETKGKRVRVYDRPEFLDDVASKFPDSIRWPNHGLPPARHVLLAGDLKAFTDVGDEIVSHGGIALEEVMVPFVAITREGA